MRCLSSPSTSASMQAAQPVRAAAAQQPTHAAAVLPRGFQGRNAAAVLPRRRQPCAGRLGSPLSLPTRRKQQQLAECSLTSHPGEEASEQGSRSTLSSLSIPTTGMAKNLGSRGAGATLERSKLSNKQSMQQSAPKLDDGMGGGGLGKGIFNGGGGDGDDGDDDDYFNDGEGDGDGDGDGFFRKVFQELYDAKAIAAVLQEWYRTMGDMPLILRQAVQMGLFSSAALVRFLSMDVRPSVTRAVTRSLPPAISREVVGRLMADPAFMQKVLIEQLITVSASVIYEAQVRGDRFMQELDLVAANTLCLSAANMALVYLVAPTRVSTAPGRHAWQNLLAQLPNNVFDRSTPMRQFSAGSRAAGFAAKAAELCGVGMLAGAAQASLARGVVALRRRADPDFQPSMPLPTLKQSALGFAATWGLFANTRYQIVAGVDRYLFDHANFLWSYLVASGVFRAVSTAVGDQTRHYLQGLPNGARVAAMREAQQQRLQQWAAQQAAAARRPSVYTRAAAAPAAAGGSKKKRRSKRSAGFEMGVQGPGAAAVAAA